MTVASPRPSGRSTITASPGATAAAGASLPGDLVRDVVDDDVGAEEAEMERPLGCESRADHRRGVVTASVPASRRRFSDWRCDRAPPARDRPPRTRATIAVARRMPAASDSSCGRSSRLASERSSALASQQAEVAQQRRHRAHPATDQLALAAGGGQAPWRRRDSRRGSAEVAAACNRLDAAARTSCASSSSCASAPPTLPCERAAAAAAASAVNRCAVAQ